MYTFPLSLCSALLFMMLFSRLIHVMLNDFGCRTLSDISILRSKLIVLTHVFLSVYSPAVFIHKKMMEKKSFPSYRFPSSNIDDHWGDVEFSCVMTLLTAFQSIE